MKLWTELTLREQTRAMGWRYQPETGTLRGPKRGQVLQGTPVALPSGGHTYTGLAALWTQWLLDHPKELYDAVAAHNEGLPPMRWSPRPGDWLVYTQRAARGGVYRTGCSGDTVRWVGWDTETLLEDETERRVGRVRGWYGGFARPKLVSWTTHPELGELRPATRDEIRAAQEDWDARDRLAWGGAR